MKFRDAIKKSVNSYMRGQMPEEAIKASKGEFIFTPEYIEGLFAEEEAKDPPKKKGRASGKK